MAHNYNYYGSASVLSLIQAEDEVPSGEDEGSVGDDSDVSMESGEGSEGGGSEEGEESDGESDELDDESGDEQEDVIKVRANLYSNSQQENTRFQYNALPIF